MANRFEGKVLFVTGAARGHGLVGMARSLAIELAPHRSCRERRWHRAEG